MSIVLAAATHNEVTIIAEWLKIHPSRETSMLITGIGSSMTAYELTRSICRSAPKLIIQAGIAGSFNDDLPPGTIGFVEKEVFADLGAAEEEGISDFFDLGLAGINDHPFSDKWLVNPETDRWKKYELPFLSSATVNNISSTAWQAEQIRSKYVPDIESMEGAALHYVCLKENIPFVQLRAISNYAGERNKKKWKMKEAISLLNETLKTILNDL